MNRFVTFFNVAGVLALAVLAGMQWRSENTLRHGRDTFQNRSEQLAGELRETKDSLADARASVEEFRKRVEVLEADNAKLGADLRASEKRAALLAADVARLEKTVAAWKDAVAERDAVIAKLNETVKHQNVAIADAARRNNDLVEKYNDLAKRFEEARKMVATARTERDKALEQLKAALAVNES